MDTSVPRIGSILIIDQERTIADIIIEILTEAGYLAYTVHDSADALAVIATVPPALLMLDIGKHRRPGAALIDQMRAAGFGAIPIVVMSADFVATVPVLLAPSVVEFLAKPFDLDDLLACVAPYVQPLVAAVASA
jgi:DNA-binding response OmpR family regulator